MQEYSLLSRISSCLGKVTLLNVCLSFLSCSHACLWFYSSTRPVPLSTDIFNHLCPETHLFSCLLNLHEILVFCFGGHPRISTHPGVTRPFSTFLPFAEGRNIYISKLFIISLVEFELQCTLWTFQLCQLDCY